MIKQTICFFALSLIQTSILYADDKTTLDVVTVTADPLHSALATLPSSATVISEDSYEGSGTSTLGDTLSLIPNVNFAGGTNEPRFFQIRGIGELEQYEGAPVSSVGLLVDDFDFTGLGSIVQTFDADQIEVLRGPQGMAFGQNALAGLMHIKLADPTPDQSGKGKIVFGSDNLAGGGLSLSGPVDGTDKKLQYHISAYHEYEDGFRHDIFRHSHTTNKRDEFTGIAKLRFLPSSDTTIDLSFLRADMDNGYDAFSIDNSFRTQSDRPGKDAQGSTGASLKASTKLTDDISLTSISSLTNSKINYSYDGDWGNNPFWGQFAPYDYFSWTFRNREQAYQELRLSTPERQYKMGEDLRWLLGAYGQRLTEGTTIENDQDGVAYDTLASDFHAWTTAGFGQVEVPLLPKTAGTFGIRVEQKNAHYTDSRLTDERPEDTMIGGNASLQYALTDDSMIYGLVSRGYKAGGVNSGTAIPSDKRTFDPEYLWNLETGIKGDFKKTGLKSNISIFYQLRRDQQTKLALQNDPNDPLSFTFLTQNASHGHNYGLEWDGAWKAARQLSISASLSLLQTRFTDFQSTDGTSISRAASHAPRWEYSLGPKYNFTDNFFAKLQVYGKDGYYYDDTFNIKSSSYSLVNLSFGYEKDTWSWTVWAKNLFDKRYAVRGFFFGDEPPDFPNKLYKQLGDPFQVGTSLTFYF